MRLPNEIKLILTDNLSFEEISTSRISIIIRIKIFLIILVYNIHKKNANDILFFSNIVPDECTDDVSALENFARVFHARYDSTGPILYIGPLDQAIQDSVNASIHNVNICIINSLKS